MTCFRPLGASNQKVVEKRPPLKFNFSRGLFSSTFWFEAPKGKETSHFVWLIQFQRIWKVSSRKGGRRFPNTCQTLLILDEDQYQHQIGPWNNVTTSVIVPYIALRTSSITAISPILEGKSEENVGRAWSLGRVFNFLKTLHKSFLS